MNMPKKTIHPYPKKENFQILPEDTVTFFKSERDRLFAAERKSRAVDGMVGEHHGAFRHPQHTKPVSGSETPSAIPSPQQAVPEKCATCPDRGRYEQGEIHWCPHCRDWISMSEFESHIAKYHTRAD